MLETLRGAGGKWTAQEGPLFNHVPLLGKAHSYSKTTKPLGTEVIHLGHL